MEAFIEQIIHFITDQGAFGVFLASVIEEIVVPIPSTVIQTGAGFFFLSDISFGWHALWILFSRIVLPSALGTTLGSLVIYGLVYWGGMPLVHRFGRYFFVTPAKVQRAHDAVMRYASLRWAFFILRFIPLLPNVFIAAAAGFIRLPLSTYLWTTFFGMAVRATYLGATGWIAGNAYQSSAAEHSIFGMFLWLALGIIAATVIVGGIVVYVKKRARHRV